MKLQEKETHKSEYNSNVVTSRIPAIKHGDFYLAESSAIIEYLDDQFPKNPALLPSDIKDRARARQIIGWIRSDVAALRSERE